MVLAPCRRLDMSDLQVVLLKPTVGLRVQLPLVPVPCLPPARGDSMRLVVLCRVNVYASRAACFRCNTPKGEADEDGTRLKAGAASDSLFDEGEAFENQALPAEEGGI